MTNIPELISSLNQALNREPILNSDDVVPDEQLHQEIGLEICIPEEASGIRVITPKFMFIFIEPTDRNKDAIYVLAEERYAGNQLSKKTVMFRGINELVGSDAALSNYLNTVTMRQGNRGWLMIRETSFFEQNSEIIEKGDDLIKSILGLNEELTSRFGAIDPWSTTGDPELNDIIKTIQKYVSDITIDTLGGILIQEGNQSLNNNQQGGFDWLKPLAVLGALFGGPPASQSSTALVKTPPPQGNAAAVPFFNKGVVPNDYNSTNNGVVPKDYNFFNDGDNDLQCEERGVRVLQ